MCGIIAVVRRPSTRATPTSQSVLDLVAGQAALLGSGPDATDAIAAVGTRLAEADAHGERLVERHERQLVELGLPLLRQGRQRRAAARVDGKALKLK